MEAFEDVRHHDKVRQGEEPGYAVEAIGTNTVNVLEGFENA